MLAAVIIEGIKGWPLIRFLILVSCVSEFNPYSKAVKEKKLERRHAGLVKFVMNTFIFKTSLEISSLLVTFKVSPCTPTHRQPDVDQSQVLSSTAASAGNFWAHSHCSILPPPPPTTLLKPSLPTPLSPPAFKCMALPGQSSPMHAASILPLPPPIRNDGERPPKSADGYRSVSLEGAELLLPAPHQSLTGR